MANLDFTVDTQPMANSLNTITSEVAVVGGAVSAMQAAVVASEREAADRVCASIDSGFFLILRTRLSQRVAQFMSSMTTKAGSMAETSAAVDHTHQQMLGDFHRIKARYAKVFAAVDRSLEERVRELDRPAMRLARLRGTLIADRQCRELPMTLLGPADNAEVALKASCARVKSRAAASIARLGSQAALIRDYVRTASVMSCGRASGPAETGAMVPVVFAETENLAIPGSFSLEVHTPTYLSPRTQAAMARAVTYGGVGGEMRGEDASRVERAFRDRVAASGLDPRVSETMLGLFRADASKGSGRP